MLDDFYRQAQGIKQLIVSKNHQPAVIDFDYAGWSTTTSTLSLPKRLMRKIMRKQLCASPNRMPRSPAPMPALWLFVMGSQNCALDPLDFSDFSAFRDVRTVYVELMTESRCPDQSSTSTSRVSCAGSKKDTSESKRQGPAA